MDAEQVKQLLGAVKVALQVTQVAAEQRRVPVLVVTESVAAVEPYNGAGNAKE